MSARDRVSRAMAREGSTRWHACSPAFANMPSPFQGESGRVPRSGLRKPVSGSSFHRVRRALEDCAGPGSGPSRPRAGRRRQAHPRRQAQRRETLRDGAPLAHELRRQGRGSRTTFWSVTTSATRSRCAARHVQDRECPTRRRRRPGQAPQRPSTSSTGHFVEDVDRAGWNGTPSAS